jgi:hypothetical protein
MEILLTVIKVSPIIILGVYFLYILKKYLTRKNELKDKEIKNKKYELFANISTEQVQGEIDKYIERYINKYITYKFIANKIIYIKQDEIEVMIKDVSKLVYLEISELYIFYIKLIININDNDDLLKYIHSRVTTIAIDITASFNSSNIS